MNRAKRTATVLLLVALSAVAILAFVSTFPAAYYAAELINLPKYAAVSWALLPDAATVVGILGALVLTDKRGRRFAILSVVLFGIASALVNVAHSLSGRIAEEPVALLVAYGLVATLALILSAETASRVVTALVPAVEAKPLPKPRPTRKVDDEETTTKALASVVTMPHKDDRASLRKRTDEEIAEAAQELRRQYEAQGKRFTVTALQQDLRLSYERAKRAAQALETQAA